MNGSSDERSIDDTTASSPGASGDAPSDTAMTERPDTDIPEGDDRGRRAGRMRFALPRRFRWPAIAGVVAVVSVAVLATMLPWQVEPAGTDLATSSPSSNASMGVIDPGVVPGSTPTERPPILAYAPTASLTAGTTAGGVVALESDFVLASVDGTAAADLASRITVEPALELAVEPGPDQASVRLRPAAPLLAGRVYRFTLTSPDGRPLDSWAFQAKQSVQVVSTVPGDTYTNVPLDTGIEVTFDQDGVIDAASHFQIRPRTEGRFEQHGRTLAFVPNRLKAATVYTVTVTKGVKVRGTDETLAQDFRFRFETAARPGAKSTTFYFPNEILDVPTTGRPDLPIWGYIEDGSAPTKARIEVYKLRDIGAAIDAFRQLRGSPRWAQWSTDSAVSTAGLRRVMAFDARLRRGGDTSWFRVPATLAPGWYLVQRPSPKRPTQVVLQVTDVAGYLTVSSSRTLVWANDLATGRALSGATVSLEGSDLGRTDDKGLLLADTPASLLAESPRRGTVAAPDPVVVVRAAGGRSMFIPAAGSSQNYGEGYGSIDGSQDYWLSYHSDRLVYRRTDTINVWGVIRERAAGAVPDEVEIQLVTGTGDPLPPPISAVRSRPGPTGTFKGSLGLRDLPEGSYDLVLRVGGDVVGSIGIQVDRILKPAYRLEVETGRRVYIRGDRIRITSRASFYEGSPVPGVPLRIDGAIERNVRTDVGGTAIYRTTARLDPDSSESGFEQQVVTVNPGRAEEGDIIGASREFIVFPSTRTIDAEATIRSDRVVVKGAVHLVDRDRLETEMAKGASPWELDPRGRPVGGATVSLTFYEEIPRKVRVGTQYDWIEKKVVQVYDYRVDYLQLRTIKVRTSANGSFSASIRDSGRKHDYHVQLKVGDADGHTSRAFAFASAGRASTDPSDFDRAYLEPTTSAAERPLGHAIGDPIDLMFRETRPVSGGRYLFQFAQRGLRDASVQSSPHLLTQFRTWALPNLTISAVHFTGKRYVLAEEYGVWFRAADRALTVGLSTTRPRYAPGDEVTLDVRTRDRKGNPVAAAVALQAVDSKLFAMGFAQDSDPLGDLYSTISSGIRWSTASHRMQRLLFGEGGDTAGGGEDEGRVDFRDALLFDVVQTDANGRATTTFRLSDDLTSWRVAAAAVTTDMQAGSQSIEVPVGLPFFVDAAIAPEYLAGDRPSIQVRTYGSALKTGSPVRITVASDSLGLAPRTVQAKAFGNVTVALPRLTPGVHAITISASSGAAGTMSDRMTRSFTVRDSRLEQTKTAHVENVGDPIPGGGRGLTTLVISDASAGRYLPLLLEVSAGEGARLERALGAAMASTLLTERYGAPEGVRPAGDFDGDLYQTPDGGIAPVPFAGNDLELTALVAIVAPERFRADHLRQYLVSVLANPKSKRERRVYALTGLAGLGDPVLPQIQALAADPQLTIREQLVTGLGAAAIGDSATARTIATGLWDRHGEEVAGSARLRVGDSADDIATATSLMAVLAAATGDARAPAFWAYAEANPRAKAPYELLAVAYVDRLIDRLPVAPAQFAVVLDGKRTVIDLDVGDAYQLSLTAAQRTGLRIETLAGMIGMTATWREAVGASAIKTDPDIRIQRSRTPAAVVDAADLVRVDLVVRFGSKAPTGCHQVTELVPSGLIALGATARWSYGQDEANDPPGVIGPFAVVGQRVMFCAEPTRKDRTVRLRYYARVITPGRYVWEPAVVESRTAPDRAAMTKEVTVRIR